MVTIKSVSATRGPRKVPMTELPESVFPPPPAPMVFGSPPPEPMEISVSQLPPPNEGVNGHWAHHCPAERDCRGPCPCVDCVASNCGFIYDRPDGSDPPPLKGPKHPFKAK